MWVKQGMGKNECVDACKEGTMLCAVCDCACLFLREMLCSVSSVDL